MRIGKFEALGMMGEGMPSRCMWVATAIGAAAGLASSLFGGHKASQAAREAEKRQREWEASENAWYKRRYNENYVDTAAGQNLVRRAKDFAKTQYKKAQGAQAVAGGTEAGAAAAKNAGLKMVGDTIANIAATDEQRKAQVDNMHHQQQGQFAQMDMNREMQRAQQVTNAAQNASNAMLSAGVAVDGVPSSRKAVAQGSTAAVNLGGDGYKVDEYGNIIT